MGPAAPPLEDTEAAQAAAGAEVAEVAIASSSLAAVGRLAMKET